MNEKLEKQNTERSPDPLVKYKETNSSLVSFANPMYNINQRIERAETPEEVEKWLKAKELLDNQEERRMQLSEQRKLEFFDEIRLTVFGSLLFISGLIMVFLKMQKPGLALIVLGIYAPMRYPLPEVLKGLSDTLKGLPNIFTNIPSLKKWRAKSMKEMFNEETSNSIFNSQVKKDKSQNIIILFYLGGLIIFFVLVLIKPDVSEGTQEALIILISLIIVFSLSVIKYILEDPQTKLPPINITENITNDRSYNVHHHNENEEQTESKS